MATSAKFWDKLAERYSKQPIADEPSYLKKLEITREYLKPDMEVIEVGCGTGSTAIIHAPFVKHIRAIDISSKMIEIAQRKADIENITNITFEKSAIDDLDVDNQSIDVVLALSILHLVENKDSVVQKIYDMLKPGGIFVSSTMCLQDDMKWLKFITPVGQLLGLMPVIKFFTKKGLERCMAEQGFEIEYSWRPGRGKAVFIVSKKPE
jgi:ubiquinone/menaquinone biosynthesis C-methylase UbiE